MVVSPAGGEGGQAAMGLAHQKGNRVTLSYRGEAFSRIKERNAQRIQDCIRKGMLKVVLNSNVGEIRPQSVLLNLAGRTEEIPNDYVWVFAGGTPPRDFLERCGLALGRRDLTREAQAEARIKGVAA